MSKSINQEKECCEKCNCVITYPRPNCDHSCHTLEEKGVCKGCKKYGKREGCYTCAPQECNEEITRTSGGFLMCAEKLPCRIHPTPKNESLEKPHDTEDEWCCACEADLAVMRNLIAKAKEEGFEIGKKVKHGTVKNEARQSLLSELKESIEGLRKKYGELWQRGGTYHADNATVDTHNSALDDVLKIMDADHLNAKE